MSKQLNNHEFREFLKKAGASIVYRIRTHNAETIGDTYAVSGEIEVEEVAVYFNDLHNEPLFTDKGQLISKNFEGIAYPYDIVNYKDNYIYSISREGIIDHFNAIVDATFNERLSRTKRSIFPLPSRKQLNISAPEHTFTFTPLPCSIVLPDLNPFKPVYKVRCDIFSGEGFSIQELLPYSQPNICHDGSIYYNFEDARFTLQPDKPTPSSGALVYRSAHTRIFVSREAADSFIEGVISTLNSLPVNLIKSKTNTPATNKEIS